MELKELLKRIYRILFIARKPTNDEFMEVAKITGFGIILFGIVGLIIYVIFNLF